MTTEDSSTAAAREVVERYAKAWLNDDLETMLGCYGESFSLHYFGDNAFTGSHVGRDTALATLLAASAKAPRKLLAVDEILAGPASAALVVREAITHGDEVRELRRVLRFRIENDQFADAWLYDEDQAYIDAAWS